MVQTSLTRVLLQVEDGVGVLRLNRPQAFNALDTNTWREIPQGLKWLEDNGARVGVLCGEGKNFCAGIDLGALSTLQQPQGSDACEGRAAYHLRHFILELQDAMTACEKARCPVIAAVHGACIGAGIDLITACDIRFCTAGAKLCVKEADLSIVADMGTLQRLPGIVGQGNACELALTARTFDGGEALRLGLVSAVFPSQEELMEGAMKVARGIAAKSPLAVAGTKRLLLYQRDHSVQDGLDYVATWNAGQVRSADLREVFAAKVQRRPPTFSKL